MAINNSLETLAYVANLRAKAAEVEKSDRAYYMGIAWRRLILLRQERGAGVGQSHIPASGIILS